MTSNPLISLWIFLRCAVQMTKIVSQGVIYGFLGKLDRARVDQFIRVWAKKMMAILQVDYQLINPHHIDFSDNKRYIIMVNHSSLFDIPICYATLPGCIRMLAKKELFSIPFFSYAMKAAEVPSVDRHNRSQAILDLQSVKQKMESGLVIWIAPEGTRSVDGRLQSLKKGGFILAIDAKAFIVPVGIRGANYILPKKTWQFHLKQRVEVHIGKPIDASEYTLENKEELISRTSDELKTLMDQDGSS